MLNRLYTWLLNSGFLKARILAWVRIGAASFGTYLITKGLADQSIADAISGAIVNIVTLYLQDLDVKVVDGKIKIALHTEPPRVTPVDPNSDVTGATIKTVKVEAHELPPV